MHVLFEVFLTFCCKLGLKYSGMRRQRPLKLVVTGLFNNFPVPEGWGQGRVGGCYCGDQRICGGALRVVDMPLSKSLHDRERDLVTCLCCVLFEAKQ